MVAKGHGPLDGSGRPCPCQSCHGHPAQEETRQHWHRHHRVVPSAVSHRQRWPNGASKAFASTAMSSMSAGIVVSASFILRSTTMMTDSRCNRRRPCPSCAPLARRRPPSLLPSPRRPPPSSSAASSGDPLPPDAAPAARPCSPTPPFCSRRRPSLSPTPLVPAYGQWAIQAIQKQANCLFFLAICAELRV